MSDYIRREEVFLILASKGAAWEAYQKVKQLPSADVEERKTGKWIVSAYELPVGTHCDNCGWAWVDHIDAVKLNPIFSHIITNYCPNCGARMVSE